MRADAFARYAVIVETLTRLAKLQLLHAADPADDFCVYSIAQEYASNNQLALSIEWFEKLLNEHPAHAYGFYHYAKVLERCDRTNEAIDALKRGLAQAKNCNDAKAAAELASYLDELTP